MLESSYYWKVKFIWFESDLILNLLIWNLNSFDGLWVKIWIDINGFIFGFSRLKEKEFLEKWRLWIVYNDINEIKSFKKCIDLISFCRKEYCIKLCCVDFNFVVIRIIDVVIIIVILGCVCLGNE